MGPLAGAIGAINGALAVMAAAFGAHGLEARLAAGLVTERQLDAFETGAEHHLYHAIALLAVGLVFRQTVRARRWALTLAAWLFLAGVLMFSGSLYLYGLFGSTALVLITPVGGLANIAGWLALAFGMLGMLNERSEGALEPKR